MRRPPPKDQFSQLLQHALEKIGRGNADETSAACTASSTAALNSADLG